MARINQTPSLEYLRQSLQSCVKMGQSDLLKTLLMTHFSNTKLSDMSELCSDLLIRVVSIGSCDQLKLILPYVDEHFLSNECNKMGKNCLSKMLCHAVTKGDKSTVELLIKKGANVNTSYEGKPLLHLALLAGHSDIAKVLIARGANVDSALMPAIFSSMDDKEDVTELILDYGADPRLAGRNGKQPIHVAAAHSGIIVQKLVGIGCDVNTQDPIHGDTPLHIACAMCNTETVEALIKCGAKFNMQNYQGETPLYKLLKFATNSHDFHAQSRSRFAKFLVEIGFTIPQVPKVKGRQGRSKVLDVYNTLKRSSKYVSTLQHLCRLKIRDNIQADSTNTVIDSLDIPVNLIRFLKFEDGYTFKETYNYNLL